MPVLVSLERDESSKLLSERGKGQGEYLLENGLCLLDVSLVVRKHLLKFLVEVDELFKQQK